MKLTSRGKQHQPNNITHRGRRKKRSNNNDYEITKYAPFVVKSMVVLIVVAGVAKIIHGNFFDDSAHLLGDKIDVKMQQEQAQAEAQAQAQQEYDRQKLRLLREISNPYSQPPLPPFVIHDNRYDILPLVSHKKFKHIDVVLQMISQQDIIIEYIKTQTNRRYKPPRCYELLAKLLNRDTDADGSIREELFGTADYNDTIDFFIEFILKFNLRELFRLPFFYGDYCDNNDNDCEMCYKCVNADMNKPLLNSNMSNDASELYKNICKHGENKDIVFNTNQKTTFLLVKNSDETHHIGANNDGTFILSSFDKNKNTIKTTHTMVSYVEYGTYKDKSVTEKLYNVCITGIHPKIVRDGKLQISNNKLKYFDNEVTYPFALYISNNTN